jgi:prepilin-type N-terminal cleavage/methylation domain-containing protein
MESRRGRRIFVKSTSSQLRYSLLLSGYSIGYMIAMPGTRFAFWQSGNTITESFTMPHPHFPKRQSGFTLIEIAIVLVIIGLLLGGILKGQELINSARVKNLATDFRNIPLFIYGYQDKFKALPGDDPGVVAHVAGTLATTPNNSQGNGAIDGNWDSTTATDESVLFWQHVRLAGLAPGTTTVPAALPGDYIPTNALGGKIGIQSAKPFTGINGSYFICSSGILGKYAKQLDTQLDDGNTSTGSMMAGATADGSAGGTTPLVDSDSYTVCMGI